MRYFVAVVQAGQMTPAADRLHLAQPALSQAIAQLERELGVPLLTRHARGVELTEAGSAFYDRACAALAAAEQAVGEARTFARASRRQLIIGFLPGLLACASSTMTAFAAAHPEIEVRSRELDFASQLSLLRAGEIDAEVMLPPPEPEAASDLEIVPVGSVPLAVNLAANHPLATRESISFAEIADEPFPGRHPQIPEHWADCYWLTAQRGQRPRVTDEQPLTPDEVWHVVSAGKCVTVGPAYFAPYIETLGGVVIRPLVDVPPAVLAIAVRQNDQRPPTRALIKTAAATPI